MGDFLKLQPHDFITNRCQIRLPIDISCNTIFHQKIIIYEDMKRIMGYIFFPTCSPSRDYIDLTTTESQVPKAFLCWTCYPHLPAKFSHPVSVIFYPLLVPILLAGIQKQRQCKVSCSGTKYKCYSCKAVTDSESNPAQRFLPSLTRVNIPTRSTPLYHIKSDS